MNGVKISIFLNKLPLYVHFFWEMKYPCYTGELDASISKVIEG
jgi:hypothetical protein